MTPKMRKWLQSYLDDTNKETFGNATASAKAAGYKCKSSECFENIGSQNYKKLMPQIEKWLDENALSDCRLKGLLVDGLQAFETKFFAHQGAVVEEKTVIPWEIRRKYLEMALKVKGLFAPEKHELAGKDGSTIDLTAIVMRVTEKNESDSQN
jgi:hypothetical protein